MNDFDPNKNNRKELMPGAAPIFYEGSKTGILFIHGFTGSAYEGKDFAAYFAEKGYTVWVPLLPGHGTRPEDMIDVTWKDWYSYAEDCLLKFKKQCQKVVLIGQSMGGAIALALAAHHPVDALITLAGAVFLADWRLKLLPVAKHFLRYQYKSRGPDISNTEAKRNSASYRKYPLKSVDDFLHMVGFARQSLSKIKDPILLIHSRRDHTVTFKNMEYIYNHVSSPIKEKLALEKSYHIISLDNERTLVYETADNFVKKLKLSP